MKLKIGIVTPSSAVSYFQLQRGVELLRESGFEVVVHPKSGRQLQYYAGPDEDRAQALIDFAQDPTIDIVWSARGGNGAARLLPRLANAKLPKSRKLFVGFSDATALMDFFQRELGWSVLHAPMPGMAEFPNQFGDELKALVAGQTFEFAPFPIQFFGSAPTATVTGSITGGNITVLASLVGTLYMPDLSNSILFLEGANQTFSTIDRLLDQLIMSNSLQKVRAIVLGEFTNCTDKTVLVQTTENTPPEKLMRKTMTSDEGLEFVFKRLSERLSIPVAGTLPVGHGAKNLPLPFGGKTTLATDGKLSIHRWDWLQS